MEYRVLMDGDVTITSGRSRGIGREGVSLLPMQTKSFSFLFSGVYRPRAPISGQPAYATEEPETAYIDLIVLLCRDRDLSCEKVKRRKISGTASRFHSVTNDAGAIIACCSTTVRRK